ncbi:MAG TPA: Ig-like domain-containing protein [Symbiobacteriaceae bacterium]|nr:Ig-like domain-containing protein [Symbiobacteriaceae bacterium]
MFRTNESRVHTNRLLQRSASLLTAAAVMAGSVAFTALPASAADTQAPPAPQHLLLDPTPTTNDGTVVLTWDQSTADDVAYYQIFRANTSSPKAGELTYLGRTEDPTNYYVDNAPTEGTFRYAVMAVDTAGNASPVSAWAQVSVDFPENGSGKITPDTTNPGTVTTLSAGDALTAYRTVDLTWTGVTADDAWRYLVYRAQGTSAAKMIGYVAAGTNGFTDVLTADGSYRYYVVAQDLTGNAGTASATVQVKVDTTAPVIRITAPVNGQTYAASTSLTVAATITDAVAGYDAGSVVYYLDGAVMDSRTVALSTLSTGAHTVTVEATDRAGNVGSAEATFVVGSVSTNPKAPQTLTGPAYSKARTVTLTWAAPLDGTVTGYKVYRSTGSQTPALAGTTASSVKTFTDTLTADGIFTYYVVAMNGTTASPRSNAAVVTVDTAAPAITVAAPKAGTTYQKSGTLAPQVTITDATSGYETDKVSYLLDGEELAGEIDLASLTDGSHTFKVTVTDRAGNVATKSVSFKVSSTATGEEPGEDENDSFIELLASLQGQIHHGHYAALMAKAKAGQYTSIIQHVIKFRGKFISPEAADKILKALGAEKMDWAKFKGGDDDDHDDDAGSSSWGGSSGGKGHGRGRK